MYNKHNVQLVSARSVLEIDSVETGVGRNIIFGNVSPA